MFFCDNEINRICLIFIFSVGDKLIGINGRRVSFDDSLELIMSQIVGVDSSQVRIMLPLYCLFLVTFIRWLFIS